MRLHPLGKCRSAFTLTEVLVALILFAIAATGLLTLFPVAHVTERESIQATRATLIASGIMESLNIADKTGCRNLPIGMSHGNILWEHVDPSENSSHTILYDSSCEPVRQMSDEEAEAGIPESNVADVVSILLATKESIPGITKAEVIVASPASAPAVRRTLHRYVMLLAVP